MNIRLRIIGIATLVIGAAAILFVFDPARAGVFPSCPFHALTGLWCPGCGSTRALHQLLHGHLAAAFRFNPLAVSLLPLVGYLAVRGERVRVKPFGVWMLPGTVVIFAVLRNIPAHPFTLLAP
jgi:hypothetical protein